MYLVPTTGRTLAADSRAHQTSERVLVTRKLVRIVVVCDRNCHHLVRGHGTAGDKYN